MDNNDGGPAFPCEGGEMSGLYADPGMTLRQYFAGQALANPALCTGTVPDWQIRSWFGDRGGISREEIVARQASEYSKAMIMLLARQSHTKG